MKSRYLWSVVVVLCSISVSAEAQTYSFKDKTGKAHNVESLHVELFGGSVGVGTVVVEDGAATVSYRLAKMSSFSIEGLDTRFRVSFLLPSSDQKLVGHLDIKDDSFDLLTPEKVKVAYTKQDGGRGKIRLEDVVWPINVEE
ncbi:MAG: hypothetical protein MI919_41855 [Holophagales bacterium]|nr:hypothetical protein [Holophagales bacterium]